jgi:hypothetical protein
MAKSFSSVVEARRLPASPIKTIILQDLTTKPADCRDFPDVLECGDSTAVLVEPVDDIHKFGGNGSEPYDLTNFDERQYEYLEFIADGRMILAAGIGTRYYIPTDILDEEDLVLFQRWAGKCSTALPAQRPRGG